MSEPNLIDQAFADFLTALDTDDVVGNLNNPDSLCIVYDYFVTREASIYRHGHTQKWIYKSLHEWISCEQRPVPVITLKAAEKNYRIHNYTTNNNITKNIYKFRFKFDQKAKCYECKTRCIAFQKDVDHYIVNKPNTITDTSWYWSSINELMCNPKQKKLYFLVYPAQKDVNPQINLMLQKLSIVRAYSDHTEIVGYKIKIQILENDQFWHKYSINGRSWLYQLSHHIYKLALKSKIITGYHHYYYKYPVKYIQYQQQQFYYIDYKTTKPLQSITDYYADFSGHQILKQQNDASPPDMEIKRVYSTDTNHKLWIGIMIYNNIINDYWKKTIAVEVGKWVHQGTPDGIKCHSAQNRLKYFINYNYIYRQNGKTTTITNKQCKIAAGL